VIAIFVYDHNLTN